MLKNLGLSLAYFQDISLNVILSRTLCQSLTISVYPMVHAMFPFPNRRERDRFHCYWHICFESVKCHIAVFMEVFFYCTPEELNEVELTVKFRKEDAQMASILNGFLNKRFLFKKIRLVLHNVTVSHPFPHLRLSSDLRSFSANILLSYYIALVS